jgi:transcriptional regulator with XRE-family HTH domain
MDDESIMLETENHPADPADAGAADINDRIARRVRELRAASGDTLDALAARSGVSRSMISLIERGAASPTAVVLDKLATGLGVALASLFEAPRESSAPQPLVRRAQQPQWRDPASGYLRRNVSPPNWPSPIQLVEVEFPAGARVAYETGAREHAPHQQVWLLRGRMDLTVGNTTHQLREGDCLAMRLDAPMVFSNPTRQAAHYVVVLCADPAPPNRRSA